MNRSYKALIESYTTYLHTLGFAPTTVYDFPRFAASFLLYCEDHGISHVKQLTTQSVFNYFAHLEQSRGIRSKRTFSTAHLNRIFLAVDKFLEFLHHSGLVSAPTPTRYTLEHVRQKPLQVLTLDEIQTLYNAAPLTFPDMTFAQCEPRQMTVKLVLDLCYGLGLRRSEALNLKTADVNFDRKIIHVRQGKNYKDRFVPMSSEVYEGLQAYVYQYRRYFNETRFSGQMSGRAERLYPFGSQSIAQSLELLVKYSDSQSLKAKKPTLHTLRHSIATHLLQNGMDIERIASFLGHTTLESTKIYTHLADEY